MSALDNLKDELHSAWPNALADNDPDEQVCVMARDLALALAVIEAANDLQGAVPGSQYRKCSRALILALAALTKTEEYK